MRHSNSIDACGKGLSDSLILRVLLSIWFLGTPIGAEADQNGMPLNLNTLAPTTPAIDQAVSRIQSLGCVTPTCVAVVRLHHIFDILSDGMMTTMGAARYFNSNEPVIEERHLHAVLLDHPNRFAPMCALLTGLASGYGRPGARKEDDFEPYVGVTALDLALRMDGSGPPHCLPMVLAAMPQTVKADTAIGDEKSECENDPVDRNLCGRIARQGKRLSIHLRVNRQ